MRMFAAGVALAIALPALPAFAEDAFLSRLAGEWTGRGTMKTSATAEPERVFCKVKNQLSQDGSALTQSGRCSLASNSGPISGTIAAMGSDLYSGTLDSLASRGPASLAGGGAADRVELNAEYIDRLSGDEARSVIVIDFVQNGYRLTSTRVDGSQKYVTSEIVFTP